MYFIAVPMETLFHFSVCLLWLLIWCSNSWWSSCKLN